jgi:hypothetical protein
MMVKNKTRFIGIRVSEDEYKIYDAMRRKIGMSDLSSFIRWCVMSFHILMSSPLYKILKPLDEISNFTEEDEEGNV